MLFHVSFWIAVDQARILGELTSRMINAVRLLVELDTKPKISRVNPD